MYGSYIYASTVYSGSGSGLTLTVDLNETLTPSDAAAKTMDKALAEVIGPSDTVSTTPLHQPLGDTITLNDWVRIEKRPSNSQFTGI